MPEPRKDEEMQEFIQCCVAYMRIVEKRPIKQAVAMCCSIWEKAKEDKNAKTKKHS